MLRRTHTYTSQIVMLNNYWPGLWTFSIPIGLNFSYKSWIFNPVWSIYFFNNWYKKNTNFNSSIRHDIFTGQSKHCMCSTTQTKYFASVVSMFASFCFLNQHPHHHHYTPFLPFCTALFFCCQWKLKSLSCFVSVCTSWSLIILVKINVLLF